MKLRVTIYAGNVDPPPVIVGVAVLGIIVILGVAVPKGSSPVCMLVLVIYGIYMIYRCQ